MRRSGTLKRVYELICKPEIFPVIDTFSTNDRLVYPEGKKIAC